MNDKFVRPEQATAPIGGNNATQPLEGNATEQARPEMVVPKSIYHAFHGKEQEAWLHGYRTAFERYGAAPLPAPLPVTDDARDAARYRWLCQNARVVPEHWGGRWSLVMECRYAGLISESIDAARASTEGKPCGS